MKKFITALIFLWIAFLLGCPQQTSRKALPPLFTLSSIMDTGAEPSFLISGDFNVDGKLDLVVTNSGDNTFSLFHGNGDGTFKDQVVFHTGADPICIASADFNRDGLPDIAELNYADQNIQIFLNTGNGSFRNTGVLLKPGKIPINLIAGDFNEDGENDLAVSLRYFKVSIIYGDGNGKFSEPHIFNVKGQPTGLAVGDYNKDQHIDVVVALAGTGNVGVEILWGKGSGEFEVSKVFRGKGQPLTLANIDANGDGYDDLVVSSNSFHSLTLFLNNGDSTFKKLQDFASGSFPKFVGVGEFTGDGVPDLAVSNATDDFISVVLGNGDGTFTYPPIFHAVEQYPQGIVVGDFDQDGLDDLAVSCRDKKLINILLHNEMVGAPTKST